MHAERTGFRGKKRENETEERNERGPAHLAVHQRRKSYSVSQTKIRHHNFENILNLQEKEKEEWRRRERGTRRTQRTDKTEEQQEREKIGDFYADVSWDVLLPQLADVCYLSLYTDIDIFILFLLFSHPSYMRCLVTHVWVGMLSFDPYAILSDGNVSVKGGTVLRVLFLEFYPQVTVWLHETNWNQQPEWRDSRVPASACRQTEHLPDPLLSPSSSSSVQGWRGIVYSSAETLSAVNQRHRDRVGSKNSITQHPVILPISLFFFFYTTASHDVITGGSNI